MRVRTAARSAAWSVSSAVSSVWEPSLSRRDISPSRGFSENLASMCTAWSAASMHLCTGVAIVMSRMFVLSLSRLGVRRPIPPPRRTVVKCVGVAFCSEENDDTHHFLASPVRRITGRARERHSHHHSQCTSRTASPQWLQSPCMARTAERAAHPFPGTADTASSQRAPSPPAAATASSQRAPSPPAAATASSAAHPFPGTADTASSQRAPSPPAAATASSQCAPRTIHTRRCARTPRATPADSDEAGQGAGRTLHCAAHA